MNRFSIFIGLSMLMVISTLPAWSETTSAADIMVEARSHWDKRTEILEVEKTVDLYQSIPADAPQAGEARWQLARCYWWLADHRDRSQRLRNLELASRAGKEAIRISPDSADAHYWLGACLGLEAADKDNLESLCLVEQSVQELETVIRLNPRHGLAQYTLGVLYLKSPSWPFSVGNLQKSLEYARQAVALHPEVVITHVGLAETLIALNCQEEARKELQKALALNGPPGLEPETADQKMLVHKIMRNLHNAKEEQSNTGATERM